MRNERRSIRLQGYDYAQAGAYFITVCSHQRAPVFGAFHNGVLIRSAIGEIVDDCWHRLPQFFPHIELDAFVIMPDHLHGIVVIIPDQIDRRTHSIDVANNLVAGTRPQSLSAIVQNFKSIVSRRVQRLFLLERSLWQRNFYEHIIRNENELARIRMYVVNNPINADTGLDRYVAM